MESVRVFQDFIGVEIAVLAAGDQHLLPLNGSEGRISPVVILRILPEVTACVLDGVDLQPLVVAGDVGARGVGALFPVHGKVHAVIALVQEIRDGLGAEEPPIAAADQRIGGNLVVFLAEIVKELHGVVGDTGHLFIVKFPAHGGTAVVAIDPVQGVAKLLFGSQRGHTTVKELVAAGGGGGKCSFLPGAAGHGEVAQGIDVGQQRVGQQYGAFAIGPVGVECQLSPHDQRLRRIRDETIAVILLGEDVIVIEIRVEAGEVLHQGLQRLEVFLHRREGQLHRTTGEGHNLSNPQIVCGKERREGIVQQHIAARLRIGDQ